MGFSSVKFTCTSLAGTNKIGNLKKNENGYYPMVVGALNIFNSAGQYYVYEQARDLFESSSQLMRRVKRGALRGECGHPKKLPGMTDAQYANRVMSIYEENVCCHHKNITLDFDNVKDEKGKPIIAIMSEVCPSGPMGPALEKSLQNPNENVCFSIRAFSDDFRERGVYKRVLKTIVTFDQVNEPGISFAEKFKAPSLEELSDIVLTRGQIERGLAITNQNVATESIVLTANELFTNMGWSIGGTNIARPHYLNWE